MGFKIDPLSYYAEDDLARQLGTTGQSFRLRKTRGQGPAHIDVPGVGRLYRGKDVLEWLEGDADVKQLWSHVNIEAAVFRALEHAKPEIAARVVGDLLKQVRDLKQGKPISGDLPRRGDTGVEEAP